MFKYMGPLGLRLFESGRILFRRPDRLNDPFEFAPKFLPLNNASTEKHAKYLLQRNYCFAQNPPPWHVYWEKHRRNYVQAFEAHAPQLLVNAPFEAQKRVNVVVLCLTEHENDLLMWSHYAEAHRGFLVEFNLDDPFFVNARMFKVRYQDERPTMHFDPEAEEAQNCARVKGKQWVGEDEWRMFKDLRKAQDSLDKEGGLFDIPGKAIKRVILGCRAAEAPDFIKKVLNFQPDIVIQRAEPNPDEFKLDYVSVQL